MNFKKPTSKRLRQSNLTEFIQITKMSKNTAKDPSVDQEENKIGGNDCDIVPKVSSDFVKPFISSVSSLSTLSVASSFSSIQTEQDESVITKLVSEDEELLRKSCLQSSVELFPSETDQSVETDYSPERAPYILRLSTEHPPNLPPLRPSEHHSVLFNYNIVPGKSPLPFPRFYVDKWDQNYVRLPCSDYNKYPVLNPATGEPSVNSRWEMIQTALLNSINSSFDLEEAILLYNSQYSGKWDFHGLHKFFTETLEPEERTSFFANLLPKMVQLCLELPNICTQPIPLLKSQMDHKISLSQHQIGSLLANAFFCTFPRRNTQSRSSEYSSYPIINFNKLFTSDSRRLKAEKLKCLLNYFNSITRKNPEGVVTFHRQNVKEFPNWQNSKKLLTKLNVQSNGLIEVDGIGMLQIDFANKFVGGGALNCGCVQEEIRFIICPELITSQLFTEQLQDNEVLIITGCEQFNQYSGYSNTFKWEGSFRDTIPRDSWHRKLTQIVAMDALHFSSDNQQFRPSLVQRELEKSYTGFVDSNTPKELLPAVATGNWGCGAFRGDPRLKVIIQLISASEAGRDLLYLTFNDEDLRRDIQKMYDFLKDVRVGQIVQMLEAYNCHLNEATQKESLYSFLFSSLATKSSESDTDVDL